MRLCLPVSSDVHASWEKGDEKATKVALALYSHFVSALILRFASLHFSPVAPFTTKLSFNSSPFQVKKTLLGWRKVRAFFFSKYIYKIFSFSVENLFGASK